MKVDGKTIPITQISLEEDAARKASQSQTAAGYLIDRSRWGSLCKMISLMFQLVFHYRDDHDHSLEFDNGVWVGWCVVARRFWGWH